MSDVFISYSRKQQDFVREVHAALHSHGLDTWVDWQDIPVSAKWRQEIFSAIDAADNVVFVISPDAAASEVCAVEIEHAVESNKRLVPVLFEPVPAGSLPAELGALHWLHFDTDGFDQCVADLVAALQTDLVWVRAHTRLLVRAQEWQRHERDDSYLLRGADLQQFQQWLSAAAQGKEPRPVELQSAFITESAAFQERELEQARALYQRALARQLAAQAELLRRQPGQIERSVLLAAESCRRLPGVEADHCLRRGLALLPEHDWRIPLEGKAEALAVSGDEQVLAVSDGDRAVRLLETATGDEVTCFAVDDAPTAVALDRDGSSLAIGTLVGEVVLRDCDSGAAIVEWRHEKRVNALLLSPDDVLLASTGGDHVLKVWDLCEDQKCLHWQFQEAVEHLAFSGDSACLAFAVGTIAVVVDLQSREILWELAHADNLADIALSPDGRFLATAGADAAAILWDLADGEVLQRYEHPERVSAVAVHPDSACVATACWDNQLRFWDVNTADELQRVPADAYICDQLQFCHDGSAVMARYRRCLRVWDVDGGERQRITVDQEVSAAAVMPGQNRVVTVGGCVRLDTLPPPQLMHLTHEYVLVSAVQRPGHADQFATLAMDGSLRLWCVRDRAVCAAALNPGAALFIRFSHDGSAVSTPSKAVVLFNTETGEELWTLDTEDSDLNPLSNVVNRNGEQVALIDKSGAAAVWDTGGGPPVAEIARDSRISLLAFSPVADVLATADRDGLLSLWNSRDGQHLASLQHPAAVSQLQFSPDGRALATSAEDCFYLWDTAAAECLWRAPGAGIVRQILFSHDNNLLACVDDAVRILDARSGEEVSVQLRSFCADSQPMTVAFDPEDAMLAVGAVDGCRIWHLAENQAMAHIDERGDMCVGFAGPYLVAAGRLQAHATLSYWRTSDLLTQASRRVSRNLTAAEWERYLENEDYRDTLDL